MDRRSLLTGIASAAAIPVMGIPAIAAPTHTTYYNREGIGVEATHELINDMSAVYKLTPDQIIEEMFGTEFHLRVVVNLRVVDRSEDVMIIEISTNDARDVFKKRYIFSDDENRVEPKTGSWIRNYGMSDDQSPLLPFRNKTNETNYKIWNEKLFDKWDRVLNEEIKDTNKDWPRTPVVL